MTESEIIKEIYNGMQEMKQQMQEMQNELRGEVKGLREEIKSVKTDLQGQITDLKLTLENETNRNIKIIAEGHLELSRKLDEAMKINNENEMMKIRLNILENDMRRVKEQIA